VLPLEKRRRENEKREGNNAEYSAAVFRNDQLRGRAMLQYRMGLKRSLFVSRGKEMDLCYNIYERICMHAMRV